MLSKIGTGELIVVLVVALLIFGPSRLPALGKMAGKALGSIRHYTNTDNWGDFLDDDDDEEEVAKPKKKKAAKKTVKVEEEAEAEEEAPEAEEPKKAAEAEETV